VAEEEDGDGGGRDTRGRGRPAAVAAVGAARPRAVRRAAPAEERARAAAGLPRVDFLRRLYESVVFLLLWVIESAVVLATLCFFFLRFGFRL